jgi:hypothetical protein
MCCVQGVANRTPLDRFGSLFIQFLLFFICQQKLRYNDDQSSMHAYYVNCSKLSRPFRSYWSFRSDADQHQNENQDPDPNQNDKDVTIDC